MAREGIYVGSREVVQRYVGTQLVWEKRIRVLELFGKRVLTSPVFGENALYIYDYNFGFRANSIDQISYIGKNESNVIAVVLKRSFDDTHVKAIFKNTQDFEKAKREFNSSNGDVYMSFYSAWR